MANPTTEAPPWTDPPTPPRTAVTKTLNRLVSMGLSVAGIIAILLNAIALGIGLSIAGIVINAADLLKGLGISADASKARQEAAAAAAAGAAAGGAAAGGTTDSTQGGQSGQGGAPVDRGRGTVG